MSIFIAIIAIAAAFTAKKAMARGLTYHAMSATVLTLSLIAVSRIWHSSRELLNLEARWSKWPEIMEYAILIAAFLGFIGLVSKIKDTETAP